MCLDLEIQQLTYVADWRWVPTGLNIANAAIRRKKVEKVISWEWFFGPSFLKNLEEIWPTKNELPSYWRGVELDMNEIRQKYWVMNCRSAVKSVFSRCLMCRIEKTKPSRPLMGQQPEARLKRVRAFVNVGMGYFGPIFLKMVGEAKIYGVCSSRV